MINILSKLLRKRGVDDFAQLSEEEKKTYREWDEVLSGKKLTDEDVATFLDQELAETLRKLDPNAPPRVDCFIKMKIEFIGKIKTFLLTPEVERKALEANINNIIDKI